MTLQNIRMDSSCLLYAHTHLCVGVFVLLALSRIVVFGTSICVEDCGYGRSTLVAEHAFLLILHLSLVRGRSGSV